jgi:hypothetical protein
MISSEYLALITSAHAEKPRFMATVESSVAPFAAIQDVLKSLPAAFDIDTAVGVQLDTIGVWVGRSRRIDAALVGVYFAWDDTDATGWESGVWQGVYDPDSGLVDLPDDSYRRLLRAKIAANSWDGSIPDAYAVWESAFDAGSFILMQDNQDMSMVVGIAGSLLSAVDKALLVGGYLNLKPEGVRISHYAAAPVAGPLFAWDAVTSGAAAGWEAGNWAIEILPT